jgi:hypothetical protein
MTASFRIQLVCGRGRGLAPAVYSVLRGTWSLEVERRSYGARASSCRRAIAAAASGAERIQMQMHICRRERQVHERSSRDEPTNHCRQGRYSAWVLVSSLYASPSPPSEIQLSLMELARGEVNTRSLILTLDGAYLASPSSKRV